MPTLKLSLPFSQLASDTASMLMLPHVRSEKKVISCLILPIGHRNY